MWLLSILALATVLVLAVLGLLAHCYRENWLQALGMAFAAVASGKLIDLVIDARYVPPAMGLYALATACYAAGTAVKVWRHRHHGGAPRTVGGLR